MKVFPKNKYVFSGIIDFYQLLTIRYVLCITEMKLTFWSINRQIQNGPHSTHGAFYTANGTGRWVCQRDGSGIVDSHNMYFLVRQKKWWSYGYFEMWTPLLLVDLISWSTNLSKLCQSTLLWPTVKHLVQVAPNPKVYMFLVSSSSCSCFRSIHWSQVLSWEWRCSWSSADRRCSNYIWVINNFIAY